MQEGLDFRSCFGLSPRARGGQGMVWPNSPWNFLLGIELGNNLKVNQVLRWPAELGLGRPSCLGCKV